MGINWTTSGEILERVENCAKYIVENKCTVRDAAKKFGVSKSTIHSDCTKKLKTLGETEPLRYSKLYTEVIDVIADNKKVRHLRGGEATKQKALRRKNKHKNKAKNKANYGVVSNEFSRKTRNK